ncbi:hypothetical protein G9F72_019170 [Clostridium estertheticum]|uniref:hypothetical protein n=1 Tax=Clostridium estertheticum TaxID=238834 RepID=UPI001CD18395|nr:hypothetical protein [Clostridium estertheticum]MBZ9688454.1 hypothetical protein [Clostridium estertheticum]
MKNKEMEDGVNMKNKEVMKNCTSVAIKNKVGVIELYPVVVVKAIALQKILGIVNK